MRNCTMKVLMASTAGVLSVASTFKVHGTIYQGQEPGASFGLIDQNSAGINNGSNACGPTATYNSFVYLRTQGIDLRGSSPSNTINALEPLMGGVPVSGGNAMAAGKQSWINSQGQSNHVSVEQLGNNTPLAATAAASFIAQQLNAGQDVEMGFLWNGTAGGGHVVTITGIDYDSTGANGAMNIIDPWDGVPISGNLDGSSGNLVLGYTGGGAGTGGADGPDPDNPGDAASGTIAFVVAESVTSAPEPSLVAIGFMVVASMGLGRRRTGRLSTIDENDDG
jgi:hypothetical protein